MKKQTRYCCEVCGMDYDNPDVALACEASPSKFLFEIGDVVRLKTTIKAGIVSDKRLRWGLLARLGHVGSNTVVLAVPARYHDFMYRLTFDDLDSTVDDLDSPIVWYDENDLESTEH